MRRKKGDPRLDALIEAWNSYPVGVRPVLMLEWPELYFAVSRLVRWEEVARAN